MKHIRTLFIIALSIFIAGFVVQPAQASGSHAENTINMSNMRQLYDDIGPLKLLMLTLTPKDQRAMYYHTVSIDASENCKSPNAWYFEGLVEDDICQQMKAQNYNVVCNTACPQERRTGITCGLSHECCLPAQQAPAETKTSPAIRCAPEGESRGIQYCTFW